MTAEDLLQTIKHLTSSGMPPEKIGEIYETLKPSMNGGFTEEHHKEVLRMISGLDSKEKNLTQEVTAWVENADGEVVNIMQCFSELELKSKQDKAAARKAFLRLAQKNVIEHHGEKSGFYRKIQAGTGEQEWWAAKGVPLKLDFPLELDQAKIYPGNIILIEGSKSQGKTRFCLEFARLNKKLFPNKRILYQNVEMADDEILKRVEAFEESGMWTLKDFRERVEVKKVTSGWWDFIRKEDINIIDYLIEYIDPYKIAQYILNIHKKLTSGIALICLQKDPAKMYGSGGYATRNIPRLIVSLQNHVIKLEDVKAFWMDTPESHNPTGMMRRYKMPGLWKMIPDTPWTKDLEVVKDKKDKKYEVFEGFDHEE
jgi:DNA-binding transcriptional MerR regulator